MISQTNRVIFFVILGFSFAIFFLATKYFYSDVDPNATFLKGSVVTIASIIFSLFFVGYIQLIDKELIDKEHEDFSVERLGPKQCRGGSYMNSGTSAKSRYCQHLASTPEGLAEINSYQCGSGFTGLPSRGFKFTPLSNNQWRNARCDTPSSDDVRANGIF